MLKIYFVHWILWPRLTLSLHSVLNYHADSLWPHHFLSTSPLSLINFSLPSLLSPHSHSTLQKKEKEINWITTTYLLTRVLLLPFALSCFPSHTSRLTQGISHTLIPSHISLIIKSHIPPITLSHRVPLSFPHDIPSLTQKPFVNPPSPSPAKPTLPSVTTFTNVTNNNSQIFLNPLHNHRCQNLHRRSLHNCAQTLAVFRRPP